MKAIVGLLNVILFTGGAVAFLFGLTIWSQAPSAIQEIGAIAMILVASVLLVGGAVMVQVRSAKSELLEELQSQ